MDRDRAPLRIALAGSVALPAAFLGLFFAFPLGKILERGLTGEGRAHVPLDVLWFTLWQASASTALTLLLGLPLAWALGRFDFPGRSVVRALVVVPFVLPTVVVATAFGTLLPDGRERGILPILAAHVFFNVAIVVRIVGGFWTGIQPRLWEAAATLGAGPVARFRAVTLPVLAPALAAATALVFLFSFTSFGVVLILGGPGRATLETEIYNQAARIFDLREAATLSLVQLGFVGVILVTLGWLERRLATAQARAGEAEVLLRPRGRQRFAVGAVLTVAAVALGAPPAALVERSLSTAGGYGLDFYRALDDATPALLVEPWHAAVNSLVFALLAAGIALALGSLVAVAVVRSRASWLDRLAMLPLGASAVMLGFGFVIAFDDPPLDLRGSPLLVPVAQALVATPFVVRILAPALRAIDPRLREAAALLGASPARVVREIDMPLVLRALAVAAGFALAISLGEFGATVFIARSDRPTLPVAIFRFLGRPGATNAGEAAALSVLLMGLTAAAVLAADRLAARRWTL